jgi:hypothetical protein
MDLDRMRRKRHFTTVEINNNLLTIDNKRHHEEIK